MHFCGTTEILGFFKDHCFFFGFNNENTPMQCTAIFHGWFSGENLSFPQ